MERLARHVRQLDRETCIDIMKDFYVQLMSNASTVEFRPTAQQFQESFTVSITLQWIGMESGIDWHHLSHPSIETTIASNPHLSTGGSHLSIQMGHEILEYPRQRGGQYLHL